jgi:hypothetical protein
LHLGSFECSINIVAVTFEYASRFSCFRIKRLIMYYFLVISVERERSSGLLLLRMKNRSYGYNTAALRKSRRKHLPGESEVGLRSYPNRHVILGMSPSTKDASSHSLVAKCVWDFWHTHNINNNYFSYTPIIIVNLRREK